MEPGGELRERVRRRAERGAADAAGLLAPARPFAAQAGAAAAGNFAGLLGVQALGLALRVSCATPVVAPVLGAAGVAGAAALAGQCSRDMARWGRTGERPTLRGFAAALAAPGNRREVALDAVIGTAFFLGLGGRFKAVLPSDIRFPGANAHLSVPARGQQYITESVREELQRIFRRFGCHHCGSRRGAVIGDHMPMNKLASAKRGGALRALDRVPGVKRMLRFLNLGPVKQRFYPQCHACFRKQGAAARLNRKRLVWHFAGASPVYLGSVVVGLRHLDSTVPPAAFLRRARALAAEAPKLPKL